MSRPVVALVTDFGIEDHYVGTMKGVILGVCPETTLVDITHLVPPHDIRAGARQLAAAYRYFPAGTVFLAVVDPGVGSARHGIAVEAGDYRFVGPDNGLLSAVLDETPPRRMVELSDRKFARATISRTFEGRDRFAPAAGWLAKGVALSSLGRGLASHVRLEWPLPVDVPDGLDAVVESVDRFGNLVTNVDRPAFDRVMRRGTIDVQIAGRPVPKVVDTYAEAAPGELCALFGSTDRLEVAVNGGSAAAEVGAGVGAPVQLRRSGQGSL